MIRALVGIFLLAQSIMIYFGIVFLIGVTMGPELIRNSGTKGLVIVGIVTLIVQGILIKVYTQPEEIEEDSEELE